MHVFTGRMPFMSRNRHCDSVKALNIDVLHQLSSSSAKWLLTNTSLSLALCHQYPKCQ